MMPEERAAVERATLTFRQIGCLATHLRLAAESSEPTLVDAIGGIETLCEYAADRLDADVFSEKPVEKVAEV